MKCEPAQVMGEKVAAIDIRKWNCPVTIFLLEGKNHDPHQAIIVIHMHKGAANVQPAHNSPTNNFATVQN